LDSAPSPIAIEQPENVEMNEIVVGLTIHDF
jgi:hypothetical protein